MKFTRSELSLLSDTKVVCVRPFPRTFRGYLFRLLLCLVPAGHVLAGVWLCVSVAGVVVGLLWLFVSYAVGFSIARGKERDDAAFDLDRRRRRQQLEERLTTLRNRRAGPTMTSMTVTRCRT